MSVGIYSLSPSQKSQGLGNGAGRTDEAGSLSPLLFLKEHISQGGGKSVKSGERYMLRA